MSTPASTKRLGGWAGHPGVAHPGKEHLIAVFIDQRHLVICNLVMITYTAIAVLGSRIRGLSGEMRSPEKRTFTVLLAVEVRD